MLAGGQAGEVRGARETGGPEKRRFDELAYRPCTGRGAATFGASRREEEDGAVGEVGCPVSCLVAWLAEMLCLTLFC